MKEGKAKHLLYLLPYTLLLIAGVWYRMQYGNTPFLDGDSGYYILPPWLKELTGQWHKGERPMPYLEFIHFTLKNGFGLAGTIAWQKALSMACSVFLVAAWLVFVNTLNKYKVLWHMLGYLMLAIYVSSPELLYYEQFVGPETASMSIMCILIFCLTLAFANNNTKTSIAALGALIFVNLYLAAPMPKWIFASLFLELVLLYWVVKKVPLLHKNKVYLLLVPHVLYLFFVPFQEYTHKIDKTSQSRVYIEFEQMAYTHFDLLAQDKNNFNLPQALQDSIIQYFHEAKHAAPDFLIGFNSDNLMWGKASDAINAHYQYNYDSIDRFYRHLNWVLVTKYPVSLTGQIAKQIGAFYVPNKAIDKNLYSHQNIAMVYQGSKELAQRFDYDLGNVLGALDTFGMPINKLKPQYLYTHGPRLIEQYPATMQEAGVKDYVTKPLMFSESFTFYKRFDWIFIASMLLFVTLRTYQRQLLHLHVISVLYVLIFIYVVTIAIVHTFDINRFVITIYPFLLITTFMAMAYIGRFALERAMYFRHVAKQKA